MYIKMFLKKNRLINFICSIRTSWNIMIAEKLNTITFREI